MRRFILMLCCLLAFSLGFGQDFLSSEAFKNLEADKQDAIRLVVEREAFKTFLEKHPNWRAESYHDGGPNWHVDVYVDDEWLAFGHANLETREIFDVKLPVELSAEAYERARDKIERLVLNDADMLARLVEPAAWDKELTYDPYEQSWKLTFWKGLEAWAIDLDAKDEGERFDIARIYDPAAFDEKQALNQQRREAIELAWEAEAIGLALEGHDTWKVHVDQIEGSRWNVAFATSEGPLFSAYVDIESWEVLETQVP